MIMPRPLSNGRKRGGFGGVVVERERELIYEMHFTEKIVQL